jgi:hypothetical protein
VRVSAFCTLLVFWGERTHAHLQQEQPPLAAAQARDASLKSKQTECVDLVGHSSVDSPPPTPPPPTPPPPLPPVGQLGPLWAKSKLRPHSRVAHPGQLQQHMDARFHVRVCACVECRVSCCVRGQHEGASVQSKSMQAPGQTLRLLKKR